MALTYPGTSESELNGIIARDSFIASLGDRDLEIKVRDRDPVDFDTAFKAAMRIETIFIRHARRRQSRLSPLSGDSGRHTHEVGK